MDRSRLGSRRREILNHIFSRAPLGTNSGNLTGVELSFVAYSAHASADPAAVRRNACDRVVHGDQDARVAVTDLAAFKGSLFGGKCALAIFGAPCRVLFARTSLSLVFLYFRIFACQRVEAGYGNVGKSFLQSISECPLKRYGIDGTCRLIVLRHRWSSRNCGYGLKIEITLQRGIFPWNLSTTCRLPDFPSDLA